MAQEKRQETHSEAPEVKATIGRPRIMEDPRVVSVTLDRVHRDLVDVFIRQNSSRGIDNVSAAVREIIERHFNLVRQD